MCSAAVLESRSSSMDVMTSWWQCCCSQHGFAALAAQFQEPRMLFKRSQMGACVTKTASNVTFYHS